MSIQLGGAQEYLPFIQPDKKWKVYYECNGACGAYDVYALHYLDGDTLIDSKRYDKLYTHLTSYNPHMVDETEISYLSALLREDTLTRKVFSYYGQNIFSSEDYYQSEKLLFDFSLDVEDTLTAYFYNQEQHHIIDSIGLDTIG